MVVVQPKPTVTGVCNTPAQCDWGVDLGLKSKLKFVVVMQPWPTVTGVCDTPSVTEVQEELKVRGCHFVQPKPTMTAEFATHPVWTRCLHQSGLSWLIILTNSGKPPVLVRLLGQRTPCTLPCIGQLHQKGEIVPPPPPLFFFFLHPSFLFRCRLSPFYIIIRWGWA